MQNLQEQGRHHLDAVVGVGHEGTQPLGVAPRQGLGRAGTGVANVKGTHTALARGQFEQDTKDVFQNSHAVGHVLGKGGGNQIEARPLYLGAPRGGDTQGGGSCGTIVRIGHDAFHFERGRGGVGEHEQRLVVECDSGGGAQDSLQAFGEDEKGWNGRQQEFVNLFPFFGRRGVVHITGGCIVGRTSSSFAERRRGGGGMVRRGTRLIPTGHQVLRQVQSKQDDRRLESILVDDAVADGGRHGPTQQDIGGFETAAEGFHLSYALGFCPLWRQHKCQGECDETIHSINMLFATPHGEYALLQRHNNKASIAPTTTTTGPPWLVLTSCKAAVA